MQTRVDKHDEKITDIKISTANILNKVTKQTGVLPSAFSVIIRLIIYSKDIIMFLISAMH